MDLGKMYINDANIVRDLWMNRAVIKRIKSGGDDGPNQQMYVGYQVASEREVHFTYFDIVVADTIYSLIRNYANEFSLRQLLMAMTGNDGQTLTAKKRELILESMDKLRTTTVCIDCREEMAAKNRTGKRRNDELIEALKAERPLLSVRVRGNGVYGVSHFDDDISMPLYTYAEMGGQIIGYPARLLRFGGAYTMDAIALNRYLIHQLERMKKDREGKIGRRIYCEERRRDIRGGYMGLFPELGWGSVEEREAGRSEKAVQNRRSRIHMQIRSLMEFYEKMGYLTTDEPGGEVFRDVRGARGEWKGIDITGEIRQLY